MFFRSFFFFVLFAMCTTVAQAAGWTVERATDNVSYSSDGTSWQKAVVGTALPNASWVRTGPRARVVLKKGDERIMYRGNALAAISVSQPKATKTRITQQRGSILLTVKKRRTQHTSIVTPHLAAVVKGTVFEVTVERGQSAVRVDKGLVEVSTGSDSVDVPAWQQAVVTSNSSAILVSDATETSINARGLVGLELAKIKSGSMAGGKGSGGEAKRNSGGNRTGNSGGNGSNSGGNGNNSGGNGNGRN